MDYKFWFWILVALIIGHAVGSKNYIFYVGNDIEKYNKAWIGIYIKAN